MIPWEFGYLPTPWRWYGEMGLVDLWVYKDTAGRRRVHGRIGRFWHSLLVPSRCHS